MLSRSWAAYLSREPTAVSCLASTCLGSPLLLSCRTTTAALLLQGDFSIYGGWLYISFVVNLSVCYAFYCLGMFYFVLKTPLSPFDPVPKFLCIKAVLFLSFWQVGETCQLS